MRITKGKNRMSGGKKTKGISRRDFIKTAGAGAVAAGFGANIIIPTKVRAAKNGKVVGISSGDTITVFDDRGPKKIRLYGIYCPVRGQAFGNRAKRFTSETVYRKSIDVYHLGVDRSGRIIGMVKVNGATLNKEIIRAGMGWVYTPHCHELIGNKWQQSQKEANKAKRGLWIDPNPIPPWDFRKRRE